MSAVWDQQSGDLAWPPVKHILKCVQNIISLVFRKRTFRTARRSRTRFTFSIHAQHAPLWFSPKRRCASAGTPLSTLHGTHASTRNTTRYLLPPLHTRRTVAHFRVADRTLLSVPSPHRPHTHTHHALHDCTEQLQTAPSSCHHTPRLDESSSIIPAREATVLPPYHCWPLRRPPSLPRAAGAQNAPPPVEERRR